MDVLYQHYTSGFAGSGVVRMRPAVNLFSGFTKPAAGP
jgi:hypothetical protein